MKTVEQLLDTEITLTEAFLLSVDGHRYSSGSEDNLREVEINVSTYTQGGVKKIIEVEVFAYLNNEWDEENTMVYYVGDKVTAREHSWVAITHPKFSLSKTNRIFTL